jgi:hypothetical protein
MSLPSLVFTVTVPALRPSLGVVIIVWAHTGSAASAKVLPSAAAVPNSAMRRVTLSSNEMRSPSIYASNILTPAKA